MAESITEKIFHDGENLKEAISLALQQRKAVLCFIRDEKETSKDWQDVIEEPTFHNQLLQTTIAIRLYAGSEQASFLAHVCPIESVPAIIIIENAKVLGNFQSAQVSTDSLRQQLKVRYGKEEETNSTSDTADNTNPSESDKDQYFVLPPSTGQMRLPNNAYDHIRDLTQKYISSGLSDSNILQLQLRQFQAAQNESINEFVSGIRQHPEGITYRLPENIMNRLLNTPASALSRSGGVKKEVGRSETVAGSASIPTSTTVPRTASAPSNEAVIGSSSSTQQQIQRNDYIKQQRERETAQREERERIKAQIKADREDRRIKEAARKEAEKAANLEALRKANSTTTNPQSTDIRIQVRTFDGSTIRSTFPRSATISDDVRPWVDGTADNNAPYNLKLILAPHPNRNIEPGEEDAVLTDLGIKGSCTMVMVPVKTFVDSYSGQVSGGVVGTAVSGGYGLVSGAVSLLYGGVRSLLGGSIQETERRDRTAGQPPEEQTDRSAGTTTGTTRVRTLADQRAESARKNDQFYNGNQLNFEPRKDDDNKGRKDD